VIPSFELGPLSIQTFGLSVALAFLAAGALLYRRFDELRWNPDLAYEATGAALFGGIVGARLWWAFGDLSALTDDPAARLLGASGLTWYGGVLGATLAVWAYGYWRRLALWQLAAAALPAVALGYTVGRVGCQISGDGDYGTASSVPWAMPYPNGVVPTTEVVHPTPIYETLWMGLVTLVLWELRDRLSPQQMVAAYLVAAGLERFVVEFWRRNTAVDGLLTVAQFTALGSVAAGLALAAAHRSRGASGAAR
jgi:phosphatidylglycerol:prolipoprotein diacylglycerol transferase